MLPVPIAELGGDDALNHAAELHRHATDAESEVSGHGPVHTGHDFRLSAFEGARYVNGSGNCADLSLDLGGHPLQVPEIVASHEDVDRRLVRRPLHELRVGDLGVDKRHAGQSRTGIGLDRADAARAFELLGRLYTKQ